MQWHSMAEETFDIKKPIIILEAEIEGRFSETAQLALDTGATHCMIPWRLARALGLNPELSTQRIETVTASGTEFVPVVFLPSMNVLGMKAKNVSAIVHDLPAKSYVDGLLGLSFLKHFKVTLDFREGVLRIE